MTAALSLPRGHHPGETPRRPMVRCVLCRNRHDLDWMFTNDLGWIVACARCHEMAGGAPTFAAVPFVLPVAA